MLVHPPSSDPMAIAGPDELRLKTSAKLPDVAGPPVGNYISVPTEARCDLLTVRYFVS